MALAAAAISLIFVFLLPPFVFVLIVVLVSASVGKSLGLRERYVKGLIRLFEFCKTRLAAQRKLSNNEQCESDTESSEDERPLDTDDEQTGSGNEVIEREIVLRPCSNQLGRTLSGTEDFNLWDPLYYVRTGVEAIVDDEVTKRFSAEELTSWNLLTRTNSRHQFVSLRLTMIWVAGFFVRYCVLLPIRVAILCVGTGLLVMCTYAVGCLREGAFKKSCNYSVTKQCFDVLSGALSLVCTYHNRENQPRNGICVANHTSPVDALVLACDNTYDLVGQRHGGFLGVLQTALSRASSHIWFERSEAKDRYAVARRLREHVEDPDKLPILIFPEGTCINNTSVMQFKKGTFEVGGTIYPVAIKYDPRFGDAFWNSSEYSMMNYVLMMMTSWAIVCDVWYLPPMTIREGETSIDFANRVKAEIARQGGLVDLIWDGGLKRSAVKKEWRELYQQEFSRRLRLHSLSNVRRSKDRASSDSTSARVAAPTAAAASSIDKSVTSSKPTSSTLGNNSAVSGGSPSVTKRPLNDDASPPVNAEAASSVSSDSRAAAAINNEPSKLSDASNFNSASVLVNRKSKTDHSQVNDTNVTVNGDSKVEELNSPIYNGQGERAKNTNSPTNEGVVGAGSSINNNNDVDEKCSSSVQNSDYKSENAMDSKCGALNMPITASVLREKAE